MEKNKKFIVYTYGTINEKTAFKCISSASFEIKDSVITFIEQGTKKRIILEIYKIKDTFRINVYYEDELKESNNERI